MTKHFKSAQNSTHKKLKDENPKKTKEESVNQNGKKIASHPKTFRALRKLQYRRELDCKLLE